MITFNTSREIPASAEEIYAAISDPDRLVLWWGPTGFTNTSTVCEFKVGGQWSFTMYGPDGKHFTNEAMFEEIEPAKRVVIRHVSKPNYRLTIGLAPSAEGTIVSWSQAFDDDEIARRIEHIAVPANDQNLERLSSEVLRKPVGG